jgi:hypothetical protein
MAQPVGVPGRRQQGRGAEGDLAVDVPAQVHAEEGQARVGHGVDQRADQVAALRLEQQVGAAERDDPRVGVRAGSHRQAVGPGACAEDGEARLGLAVRVPEGPRTHAVHGASGEHLNLLLAQLVGDRPSHRGEVDDPRRGRVERGHAGGVGLELPELLGAQPAQPRHAVCSAPALELVEPREL